jgi:hypothetical protein
MDRQIRREWLVLGAPNTSLTLQAGRLQVDNEDLDFNFEEDERIIDLDALATDDKPISAAWQQKIDQYNINKKEPSNVIEAFNAESDKRLDDLAVDSAKAALKRFSDKYANALAALDALQARFQEA